MCSRSSIYRSVAKTLGTQAGKALAEGKISESVAIVIATVSVVNALRENDPELNETAFRTRYAEAVNAAKAEFKPAEITAEAPVAVPAEVSAQ
jgi:hypothetical protein